MHSSQPQPQSRPTPATPRQRAARRRAAAASSISRRRDALAAYARLLPTIRRLHRQGLSFARIAAHLNAKEQATRGGGRWYAMLVLRVLDRADHEQQTRSKP
jgi:hypothetical protein